jgi:hypothetical protein
MFWNKKKEEKQFEYCSVEHLNSLKKRLSYLQGLFTYWNRQQQDGRRTHYEKERMYLSNKSMIDHHQTEINSLQKQIEYIEVMLKKEP